MTTPEQVVASLNVFQEKFERLQTKVDDLEREKAARAKKTREEEERAARQQPPPISLEERERRVEINQIVSELSQRITSPFIFTVALDSVQKAASQQPQSPIVVLGFAGILVAVTVLNARLGLYVDVHFKDLGAWKTTMELAVYLADLAAKIMAIIFSTLSGAVISDLFKSLPTAEVASILLLVILFLCIFKLAQNAVLKKAKLR
tara:strand:- start:1000 stop:1614 length:615 start_codon:yes stop_codon:yes gene_type:complete